MAGNCADPDWRMFQWKFDYAWKWLEHHAKQRYSAFNFFILFVGILAGAYATLLADGKFYSAAAMALVAAFITIFFRILDRRNEQLVSLGKNVLKGLETERGLNPGIYLAPGFDSKSRHRIWMPGIQYLISVCFAGGLVWALAQGIIQKQPEPVPLVQMSCEPGKDNVIVTCSLYRKEPQSAASAH